MISPISTASPFQANATQGFSASFSYHRLEVNGQVVSQGQSGSVNPWAMGDRFQAAGAAGHGLSAQHPGADQGVAAAQTRGCNPAAQHPPQGRPLMRGLLQQIGQLTQVLQSLVQMISGLLPQNQNPVAAQPVNAQQNPALAQPVTMQANAAVAPAAPTVPGN